MNTMVVAEPQNEYEIKPTKLASELLKITTGQYPESSETTVALAMDSESIISIKRYEKKGLSLPNTEGEVQTSLDGVESDIEGLKNADILVTYLNIITNAGKWACLEQGMVTLATQLSVFADEMLSNGQYSIDFLNETLDKYYKPGLDFSLDDVDPNKLEDPEYIQELLEKLDPDAEYDAEEDARNLEKVKRLIDRLIDTSEGYYTQTNQLYNNLIVFRNEMRDCSDDVTKKDQLCNDLDLDADIQALKEQRDDLKEQIEALNQQYDKNVGLAFTGVFGGTIGLAITGGIFGSKAEKIRKDINAKKADLDKINEEIKTKEKLLEAITSLDNEFTNLFTVMNQAEIGLNQLVTTWTTIKEYLQQSHDAIDNIQNSENLFFYSLDLIGMVDPWKGVGDNAAIVTQQINDALDQWNQSQQ